MTGTAWQGLALPHGARIRPATDDTIDFAQGLYVATMRPLLERLGAWDDDLMLAHFRAGYVAEQVWVVELGGVGVGYLQVLETPGEVILLQLHLAATVRRRGIGSALIRALLAHARKRGKPVRLSVVRHNPAIALYQRLGFEVVEKDRLRLHMRWQPAAPVAVVEAVPAAALARPTRRRSTRRGSGS